MELARSTKQAVLGLLRENLPVVGSRAVTDRFLGQPNVAHVVLGPAAAHAVLWKLGGAEEDRQSARDLVDLFLADRGRPRAAGRLRNRLRLASSPQFWDMRESIEAGSTLGWIATLLGGEDAERLQPVIDAAMAAVVRDDGLNFYVNGNYAIPQVELAWFARGAGPGGADAYERSWTMLVEPRIAGNKWEGYGWIQEGEAGYFSETPGRKLPRPTDTFDVEYTLLQVDRMARLWLATHDDRALEYLRMLHRQVWKLADRTAWTLDGRGGSRRNQEIPFYTAGTVLLAAFGEVSAEEAEDQVDKAVLTGFRYDPVHFDAYRMRGYGLTLLSLIL